MDVSAISDSVIHLVDRPVACPVCGSEATVHGGSCVRCLLCAGLEETEDGNLEQFEAVLAEIDIPDTDWRLGNYQVLEEIGRGGMGVIYRARQRYSKRTVALKRVLSYHGDSSETLERFRREAEAVASLDHPNILPIYEVGESDGLPFFTMKYASGGSLQEVGPALAHDPRECVRLLALVTRAVAYAHKQGILHRDLKPGNILLDGRREPLVSDFGLAKWIDADSDLTRSLAIYGTPGFIAPEQADGPRSALTAAADIYSLGAILFHLLTKRPPFLGEHAIAVIRQASEKSAPKLRTLAPHAPRDLETICAKCLEREPTARYASADDLAEDLERWMDGRSIRARPVSPPAQLWRWAGRNPLLAGVAAACLALAAVGVTRQINAQRLQAALNQEQIAAHSISVLPLLDLDTGGPASDAAVEMAAVLGRHMQPLGFGRIEPIPQPSERWTGVGLREEVQAAAKQAGSRTVLTGTRRQVQGATRHSLHLVSAATGESLTGWVFDVNDGSSLDQTLRTQEIAIAAYRLLDRGELSAPAEIDPGMANERARPFIVTGRDLLTRRNIPDMDRAIGCLENAVREEPRSITARAFLAMACMGRDLLAPDPAIAARALANARGAVELAPESPAGHRAHAMISISFGRYAEGIEHAFRAIEYGDQTERAFGHIGFGWRMRGRPDLALVWYEKARASRRQPDFDALLGDCYSDLELNHLAQQAFQSAALYQPDHPEGWIGLCHLKLAEGDFDGAREICRNELPNYPGSPPAAQMEALIEFFARNFETAGQLYSRLAAGSPDGGGRAAISGAVDFASALARMKIEGGDRAGAEPLLTRRIQLEQAHLADAPEDAESLYRLAAAQALAGDETSSLQSLRNAADAGWLDYRSLRRDPRFDSVAQTPEFQKIVSQISTRVAYLRERAGTAAEDPKMRP